MWSGGRGGGKKTRKGGHGEAIFFEEGLPLTTGGTSKCVGGCCTVLNRACTEVLPKTSAKSAKKLPLELEN